MHRKLNKIFDVHLDDFNNGFARNYGNEGIMPNPNSEIQPGMQNVPIVIDDPIQNEENSGGEDQSGNGEEDGEEEQE